LVIWPSISWTAINIRVALAVLVFSPGVKIGSLITASCFSVAFTVQGIAFIIIPYWDSVAAFLTSITKWAQQVGPPSIPWTAEKTFVTCTIFVVCILVSRAAHYVGVAFAFFVSWVGVSWAAIIVAVAAVVVPRVFIVRAAIIVAVAAFIKEAAAR